MDDAAALHAAAEEFRERGHAVVDWLASYLARLEDLPVMPTVAPGEVRARLPAAPPEHPEPFERLLADLDNIVVPALLQWQHPGFFGYFPANASPVSALADLVSSGLGAQGMLWSTGPALTEVESHVLDWLVDAMGLPAAYRSDGPGGGVIQDSASSATLCALVAARERASGGHSNTDGVAGRLTTYATAHAHSSLLKGVRVAGLGGTNLQEVPHDQAGAMRPAALRDRIRADRAAGGVPTLVTATVGTTSSSAVDPVRAIGEICAEEGVWLHVDAAYAGSAAVCPEHRSLLDGLEYADSYVFDPHKWLLTNFDCSAFWVRDRRALTDALTVTPEYLRNPATETGQVIDYRDWHVPLGRRFRALKLWWVLRSYGLEGLRAHVRRHVAWAQEFAGLVDADDRFEVAAPHPLSLVCFRHHDGDVANAWILDRVNAGGRVFLTHTRLDGQHTLRLAVGGMWTRRRDVLAAWDEICAAAAAWEAGQPRA